MNRTPETTEELAERMSARARRARTPDPTTELAAELAILTEYDTTRGYVGHDYGSGQRRAELARREHALPEGWRDATPEDFTAAELTRAFERVGAPRWRRAIAEEYRRETPATRRTLAAWRSVAVSLGIPAEDRPPPR